MSEALGGGGPRIPLLAVEEAKRRAAEVGVPEYVAELSIFQVLLHHPTLAKGFNDLLSRLLLKATFDTRLRELAIMRIGWITGSVYEWTQHWRLARLFEVSEEDLLAVRDWEGDGADRFGPAERAVLAAVDETVRDGAVSAATWDALAEHVSNDPEVLLEITLTVGLWRMVSSALRTLEVPLEPGVEPWPPDGRAPA